MSDNYNSYNQFQQHSVFDQEPILAERAGTGVRFANFIIDMIATYAVIFGITIALTLFVPSFADYINENSDDLSFKLMDRLATALAVAVLFTLVEGLSKGRSLGKLITGTVAVREDGAPFTWTEAWKRSFSRIVPFEPFSTFGGHPWHDKWSNTIVVKK